MRQGWGMRVVHVARDRDEAWRASEAPFMGYQRRMAALRSESTGGGLTDSFDRALVQVRPFNEYIDSGAAFIGTPEDVASGLQKYLDATGLQRVMLLTAIPGLGVDAAMESMRLFAEEVAPALVPITQSA
jgi:alkanesulfonate monooxygenase SsuD/methylene tetrahydromethanopterin reductase-like flavin-dependent oxidoreductase (luciferase family)